MMAQQSILLMVMYSSAVVTYAVDFRLKRSDDVPAFAAVVENLSQRVSQLSAQLTLMENKHTALENKFNVAQTSVAFHAHHTADPFSVASQGTIIYDTIDLNIGNGYDKQTGLFTAPVAGTYVFFLNCMAYLNHEEINLLVDGNRVASCYSYIASGQPSELGATLATVHLVVGQRVWVRRILQDAELVRGYDWNIFTGFLVRVDV